MVRGSIPRDARVHGSFCALVGSNDRDGPAYWIRRSLHRQTLSWSRGVARLPMLLAHIRDRDRARASRSRKRLARCRFKTWTCAWHVRRWSHSGADGMAFFLYRSRPRQFGLAGSMAMVHSPVRCATRYAVNPYRPKQASASANIPKMPVSRDMRSSRVKFRSVD